MRTSARGLLAKRVVSARTLEPPMTPAEREQKDRDIQAAIRETESNVVKYNPSDARILEVKQEFAELLVKLPELVEKEDEAPLKAALKTIVPLRTELEKCRQSLKEEALRHGQKIDAEARRLKGLILEFETPINKALDDIAAAQRERAEAKVRAEEALAAQEAKAKADAEAALKEAERQKEEAERAAERAKLEAEKAAFEEKRKAQEAEDKARRDKLEAEEKAHAEKKAKEDAETARQKAEVEAQAAKVKADLEAVERAKREKEIAEKAAADAKAKAEKDVADRAEQEKLRQEREAAETRAAELARPDIEKIRAFGRTLTDISVPVLKTGTPAAEFLSAIVRDLGAIATRCIQFTHKKR